MTVLFNTFDTYCRTEKPFLDQVCNLNFIAQKVAIKPYLISQVLNSYAQKTFNEYLNELKVEEVKKNLQSDRYKMLTIDAIGELSGFRSKATFYTAFKKIYKQTPLQYRKNQSKI
jgi:AraC-like DNA-binding protein